MKFFKWLKEIFGFKKAFPLEMVFTPTRSAKLNYVKRPSIESKIVRSVKIPGTQVILYGHSGGGKTTTIRNVLNQLNRNFIITSCISGSTVDELILNAFDQLNPYYISEKSTKSSTTISSGLKASYKKIESSISSEFSSEESTTEKRLLPVQLTFQRLGEFLGGADCVWVIEDFHKVEESEKEKLSDVMKSFVDLANDYPNVKIVAIGAVSTAREVVNYNDELSERVAEIPVPLMTASELEKIIINGSELLNVKFDEQLVKDTVHYSNSLAAICHQLCFSHCEQMGIEESSKELVKIKRGILKKSIQVYVSNKSDSFQQRLDKALKQRKGKFENVKLILKAIISLNKEEVTYNEILTEIHKSEPDYPQGNLTNYLKLLTASKHDELLRYDDNSGKYSFSDPFFKAFCAMVFESLEKEKDTIDKIDLAPIFDKFIRMISEKSTEEWVKIDFKSNKLN